MREIRNLLIFILSSFHLVGCGQENIDKKFEQNVFIEILPKIVDSMFVDIRPIQLPKEIISEKNIKLKRKKWKEYQTSYYKKIPKYNTELTIAIVENLETFNNIPSAKVDFKKIQNTKKFIFKNRNEFPLNSEIWKEKLKYSFVGIFAFSRIQFDKEKLNGEIYVNYRCGNLCGKGGTVYIKKESGKWKIERILIEDVS